MRDSVVREYERDIQSWHPYIIQEAYMSDIAFVTTILSNCERKTQDVVDWKDDLPWYS